MNLPIYRAKKINSDEYATSMTIREDYRNDWKEMLEGEWTDNRRDFIDMWIDKEKKWVEIDQTTLSINFPDMLDSQGNKIFASLSEDGKGGDILGISGRTETLFINESVIQTYTFKWDDLKDFKKIIIGIQE